MRPARARRTGGLCLRAHGEAIVSGPIEPNPMSRRKAVACVVGGPLLLGALLFLPAGSLAWTAGWVFLLMSLLAVAVSTAVLWRVNPMIFRARSRFQRGTKLWDRRLLAVILPMAAAILPVAALDAGRFRWTALPAWTIVAGYILLLVAFALTAWAQAVNEFFEPGVRIQSERQQRAIDTGPYAVIRHPGYFAAMLLFAGMALSLGSLWALIPAALASAGLVVRTVWEDRLLRTELPGYQDYARRIRWRLVPGLW